MKVLYVSLVRLASRTGDTEHVFSVCREMALQGVDVHLIAVSSTISSRRSGADLGLHVHPVPEGGGGALEIVRRVSAEARRLVRELGPDVVYVRPFPLDWVFLLRHLRRSGMPYVCEFNTLTATEYRSKGQPLKGRIYEWFDAVSIRNALGIVTVTEEIGAWASRISGVRKPMLVAGNGVDAEHVPLLGADARAVHRARLGVTSDTLVLAMVGFSRPWHGSDRAVAMLAYLGPEVRLWLIGAPTVESSGSVQEIARDLGVEKRLRIFPQLESTPLAELLAAADIGIGPLALDRKAMTEAQPIKVRLYLASGLPVLYNYVDPKLQGTLPFVNYVASTEPRDLAAGIGKLRDLEPNRESVRAFAIKQLSWAAIAAETRRFLSAITNPAVR